MDPDQEDKDSFQRNDVLELIVRELDEPLFANGCQAPVLFIF